jgi:hypothetical protein
MSTRTGGPEVLGSGVLNAYGSSGRDSARIVSTVIAWNTERSSMKGTCAEFLTRRAVIRRPKR